MVQYIWIILIKIFVLEIDVFKASEISLGSSTLPLPVDVWLIPIDTSTLRLSWSPPAISNNTLIGFNITWDENKTFVDDSTTAFNITNLGTPGGFYTANISAYYADVGNSEYVNVSNNTFPSTPYNLTVEYRDTNWLSISYENHGEWDTCFVWADNATGSNGSCSAKSRIANITNLPVAGQEYTIHIVAQSGSLNSSGAITMERTNPKPAANITVVSRQINGFELRWTNDGESDKCIVSVEEALNATASCFHGNKTATITDLPTAGKVYTVHVLIQIDQLSSTDSTTTVRTFPSTPYDLIVVHRDTYWLNISFKNQGVWDACYVWANDALGSNGICSVGSNMAIISNLPVAGKEYTIHIVAESGSLNSSNATAMERTIPPDPGSPYCNSTTNSSLSIVIGPPGGRFELDGYTISIDSQIPLFNYSTNRTVNATTAEPIVVFLEPGLTAGVTYLVEAKTRIKNLVSSGQNSSVCTTDLNAPIDVWLNSTSETVIVINWQTPQGNFDGFNASCDGQNNATDVFSVLYRRPGPDNTTTNTCKNVTAGAHYAVTVSTILNQTNLTSVKSAVPVRIATDPLSPRNITAYPNDSNSIQMDLLYGYVVTESQCTNYEILYSNYEILYSNKTEVIACSVMLVKHSLHGLQVDSPYNISTYALSNYSYLNGVASVSSRSRNSFQTLAWTLAPPVTNITGNVSSPRSLEIIIGHQPLYRYVWRYVIHVRNSTHLVQRVQITCSDAVEMTLTKVNCQWDVSSSVLNWNATCSTGLVYNITDLKPYTNYTVAVQAVNPGGCSQPESIVLMTEESTPLCLNIANTSVDIYTVNVTWNASTEPNGVITGYQLTYSYEEGHDPNYVTKTEVIQTNETFITLNGLNAYTNHTIKVAAVNRAGVGTYEGCPYSVVTVQTLTGKPHEPQLKVTPQSHRSALINWTSSDDKRTGPETYYNLTITDARNSTLIIYEHIIGFENRSVVVDGLDEYWNYSVAIVAYTINENDEELATNGTEIAYFQTLQSTPGSVSLFEVISLSHKEQCNASRVTWEQPNERDLNGIITHYVIRWYQINSGDSGLWQVPANEREATVRVEPDNKQYNFTIQAKTIEGEGDLKAQILRSTGSCFPVPVENVSSILMKANSGDEASTTKTFPVIFDRNFFFKNDNGNVTQSGIFVREVSEGENVTEKEERGGRSLYSQSLTWSEAIKKDKIPEYRATADNWLSDSSPVTRKKRSSSSQYIIIIGQNDCSKDVNETCNGPLPSNRFYRVRAIVCTEKGCYKTEYTVYIYRTKAPPEPPIWIVGVVIGAIAAGVLVLILIYDIRRRPKFWQEKVFVSYRRKPPTEDSGHEGSGRNHQQRRITSKPMPLDSFKDLITSMHCDSELLFSDEYREIQESSPKHPWTNAEQEPNKTKNRFVNILPFDNSRVKLEQSQTGSDYINANYIPNGADRFEYIASQGPLQSTLEDFWQMIWQEKSTVIVMLTNLRENGRVKCEQYWPKNKDENIEFGLVSVTLIDEQDFSSYILRRFTAKVRGESRQVVQFHFMAWPDFGVPAEPQLLIDFVKDVRRCIGQRIEPPTIVHCSAGVGRTGTFIALDRLLRQVTNSMSIDIFGTVLQLREYRCQMVQTETQYIFIHDCMALEIERMRNPESQYEGAYNSSYDFASEPLYANQEQISLSTFGKVL